MPTAIDFHHFVSRLDTTNFTHGIRQSLNVVNAGL
jgi:hypothetical protein